MQTALVSAESSAARELTAREFDIVRCVANGLRNAVVGEQLSITEATVKSHLNNIFQKLGMGHRLELVRYAISSGLVSATKRDNTP